MKYAIRIFFRADNAISLRDITEIAEDGKYLDEDPKFDSPPHPADADVIEWKFLTMTWKSDKDPIVFRNHYQDDELRNEVVRLTHILKISRKTKPGQRVADHLQQTVRMLVIEMNRDEMIDEVWVMLDAIEAHLARRYQGIIFTQEGAFFDQNLKRFYKL